MTDIVVACGIVDMERNHQETTRTAVELEPCTLVGAGTNMQI